MKVKEFYVAAASAWAVDITPILKNKVMSFKMQKTLSNITQQYPQWALKSPMFYHSWLFLTPDIKTDYETWEGVCRRMLETCDGLLVIQTPEIAHSVGVKAEVKLAQQLDKIIVYYPGVL